MVILLILIIILLFYIIKNKKENLNNKKKLICFSLWGNNDCYNWGALENALLAKKIYPGWTCRFYVGKNIISDVINKLQELDNTELIFIEKSKGLSNMFWRFKPFFEEDCYACLSRDTDSRLTLREKKMTDLWLKSNKNIFIIRDHKEHNSKIMGGMFGVKNNKFKKFKKKFNDDYNNSKNIYDQDQKFLRSIYKYIKNDAIIFDNFYRYKDENVTYFEHNPNNFIGKVNCYNFDEIKKKYNINIKKKKRTRENTI